MPSIPLLLCVLAQGAPAQSPAATQARPQPASSQPASSQPASQPAVQAASVAFTPITQVEKRGDGPIAMVLIPGLSCDWTVFEAFMERNKSRYTMYAVTLPGFGGTEPPPMPPENQFGAWLDNADKAVWKVIQDRKIEKPVIVGHSLGGHVALNLGTWHSKDLRAVVAVDGSPAFPIGAPGEDDRQQRNGMAKQMAARMAARTPEQWEQQQRLSVMGMVTNPERGKELADLCLKVPRQTTSQYMLELIAADIREQLPNLTCPTLEVTSAATTDPAMLKYVHQTWRDTFNGAPNVTFAYFDDTRHFIMEDRPAELDAAISDFLAGREPKGYSPPPASQPAPPPPPPSPPSSQPAN